MTHNITVNEFKITVYTGHNPMPVIIHHKGVEIARIEHSEVKDLEYALTRVRDMIRASLPEQYKHEA